ncbi:acyl-CoA thioesterase [Streptomyces benahoarensis]|uniref:Acyl-CoA thioesterase n=1 Tax=Streptomyces benahoarensis TaxID=2595054 RepID=A0A553ZRK9_9ACTN|nr:hotdog domain-containing protein [Streptomyces benahoarensis]TSB32723.1 acyl-CoA thioesterase [Streptomyces benahoarensis]TSB44118.1 acyl-CoA thioesterase [Streptomyces benahoarensis]
MDVPHLLHAAPVHFDELDLNGHLHNTRYALHVERATTAAFAGAGYDTGGAGERHPDLRYVVRQFAIEFQAPVDGADRLAVDLWLTHLGRTSMRWRFHARQGGDPLPRATGTRTLVKVGPDGRPSPWSRTMRLWHAALRDGSAKART